MSNLPPDRDNLPKTGWKPTQLLWLVVAFIPSAVGIPCLSIRNPTPVLPAILVLIGLGCCVGSAIGLFRGVRNPAVRSLLSVAYVLTFLVINVSIVIFAGCSGIGRIGR